MKVQVALAFSFLSLAPIAATAETQEEQQACMNDAFNVCGHAIPDRDRVAACLAHNISRISAACRNVMARYPKPKASSRYAADQQYGADHRYRIAPRYTGDSRYSQQYNY